MFYYVHCVQLIMKYISFHFISFHSIYSLLGCYISSLVAYKQDTTETQKQLSFETMVQGNIMVQGNNGHLKQ